MAFEIKIAEPAETDLFETFALINEVAPRSAKLWLNRIYAAILTLRNMPERCPIAPESEDLAREIRHLIFGRKRSAFRIIFDVIHQQKLVRILRVWRSSRDRLREKDFEDLEAKVEKLGKDLLASRQCTESETIPWNKHKLRENPLSKKDKNTSKRKKH